MQNQPQNTPQPNNRTCTVPNVRVYVCAPNNVVPNIPITKDQIIFTAQSIKVTVSNSMVDFSKGISGLKISARDFNQLTPSMQPTTVNIINFTKKHTYNFECMYIKREANNSVYYFNATSQTQANGYIVNVDEGLQFRKFSINQHEVGRIQHALEQLKNPILLPVSSGNSITSASQPAVPLLNYYNSTTTVTTSTTITHGTSVPQPINSTQKRSREDVEDIAAMALIGFKEEHASKYLKGSGGQRIPYNQGK